MFLLHKFIRLYRPFIGSIILIPASILVVLFGLYPAVMRLNSMYSEYNTTSAEVKILKRKLSQIETLSDENLLETLKIATSMIPVEKSIPSILSTVEGVASQSQVEIIELNLDSAGSIASQSAQDNPKEDKSAGVFVLPFSVSAYGTLDQINNFFHQIVAVRRLLRIEGFTITAKESQLQVTATFEALYSPLRNEAYDAQSELSPVTQDEQSLLDSIAQLPDYTNTKTIIGDGGSVGVGVKSNPFSAY